MKERINPIFILGNPRSGTTLLRLILTNHSNIVIAPECSFVLWWQNKYENWSAVDNETRIDEFIDDLLSSKKIEHWELNKNELKNEIENIKPSNYSKLCEIIYLNYANKFDKNYTYWGDKNNYYVSHPQKLYQLFPDAYFIHIIRDLRDVCCSYKQMRQIEENIPYAPNLTSNIKEIAKEWVINNETVINFTSQLNRHNCLSLRYEDLVLDTNQVINKICSFLNLNVDENMLQYYEDKNKSFFEPNTYKSWKSRNFKAIDSSKIGRYKSELSKNEIEQLNKLANDLLLRFKYI